MEQEKEKQYLTFRELCVENRLIYGDLIRGGKGREWGNCETCVKKFR